MLLPRWDSLQCFHNPAFRRDKEMVNTTCLSIAVISVLAFARATSSDSFEDDSSSFECFATTDLVRVFEDGYESKINCQNTINVFGLRNEIVSAQCFVQAYEDVEGLSVSVGSFKQSEGSAVISTGNVAWNFVKSIFIQENTPKLQKSDLIRSAPAWFPDYLSDERDCSVKKGALKAIYLTIKIPQGAEPGEYRAEVAIKAGDVNVSLPLVLTVYPLTLPDERHIMVTEWFSTNQFKKHHDLDPADSESFFKILRLYAENMAEHRQNVFRVSIDLIDRTMTADGKLRFDFSRFDQWAQVFWDTERMDLLETGFIASFGESRWYSTDVVLRDYQVRDESAGESRKLSGEEFLPQFLPAFAEHLREKGWLKKTIFHICDEPSNHNITSWRNVSDFAHRYAPELRRLDAIESPHCLNRLEIWVPKLDHLSTWQDMYEEAQRRGYEVWFYTVGIYQGGSLPNKTVDVPLIESRLMHWLNCRYGLKGYLHWGFNAWTDDPFNAPGQHRGDGWHVYPKGDGLLNSLRWEQMRNGLQDYECLWLLQDKIGKIRSTLSDRVAELIEPSRRGVEIATQVINTYTEYSREPDVLYAAKRQAIEEILDLDKSPRVILQTNPLEHSAVANNCAIDVHGWTEPGAKIKVNGRELPVASDGLFIEQMSPSPEGTIALEAESSDVRKIIIRKFKLLY
jgi:hypothetical protein